MPRIAVCMLRNSGIVSWDDEPPKQRNSRAIYARRALIQNFSEFDVSILADGQTFESMGFARLIKWGTSRSRSGPNIGDLAFVAPVINNSSIGHLSGVETPIGNGFKYLLELAFGPDGLKIIRRNQGPTILTWE